MEPSHPTAPSPAPRSEIRLRAGIVAELVRFLWKRKLWWLVPMVLTLALLAALLIFAQATGLAPFIYPLF